METERLSPKSPIETDEVRAETTDGSENVTMAASISIIEGSTSSQHDPEKVSDRPTVVPAAATVMPPPGMPKPPNGGRQAWLQVFGGFWVYFNTWGLIITFGVFQTYYETHLISQYSSSSISWIGTIQAFLLIEIGIIAGPLCDQGYSRHLVAAGSLLLTLGFMMASLAEEYYSIILSLGVCGGLGMGMLFFPGISIFTAYFTTRRGLANGLAASGSAIGAVIYPIVLRQVIEKVSFPWAVRVVGFIILATTIVPIVLLKPLLLPQGKRKSFDKTILEDRVYILFSLTNLIGWLGAQIPLFYAGPFAEFALRRSEAQSFYMLAIIGAGSLPGRLLAPLLSDRVVGPLHVYPAFMALAGVLTLIWIRVTTYGGLIIVALLYGFAYGGVVSLPPPAVGAMTKDLRTLGTRIGFVFSFAGISVLVGPPIAGAIEGGLGGFKGLFGFAGAAMLVGSILLAGVAWLHDMEVKRDREMAAAQA